MEVNLQLKNKPAKKLQGNIVAVRETIDNLLHSFKVVAQINNPDKSIAIGSLANITVIVEPNQEVLAIPRSIYFTEDKLHYVYVMRNKKAVKTQVKLSAKYNGYIKVDEGLNENDILIIKSSEPLYDRAKVTLKKPIKRKIKKKLKTVINNLRIGG